MSVEPLRSFRERYLTIEEAAQELGGTRHSVYTATKRGHLRPLRHERRNFFLREDVAAYKEHLAHRWPSKEEARALYELYPQLPVTDSGQTLVSPTAWDIFVAYASDQSSTYERIGEQFHITRQRVEQHVNLTIERLLSLETL